MIKLKQILHNKKQPKQFWLAVIGLGIGLTACLIAILLLIDIKGLEHEETDVFGENTLVIQKQVTRMSTLGLNETHFTDVEIEKLKSSDFILEVASFESANYEVGISENPGDGLPGFYAEMFLQSVPNSFLLDLDTSVWHWETEQDIVPIILPRDFLTLVNYGIAPSKGMPQISEELIKSVRIKLHLIGKRNKGVLLGRVVGFSSQISSVLVPATFIEYSNQKYGNKVQTKPTRLFIRTKANSYSEVLDIIKDMNLDISESELSISKITTYLLLMIAVFLIFSVIILSLALLSFLQYLQMILFQLNDEVSLLIQIGYEPKTIVMVLQKAFFNIFARISVCAILIVFLLNLLYIKPFMEDLGLITDYRGIIFGILFVIILIGGCVLLIKQVLTQTILKIFKK
ncbi:MAG: hypothetical protein AB8B74_12230 [Crocinitomicaceae bacterium]